MVGSIGQELLLIHCTCVELLFRCMGGVVHSLHGWSCSFGIVRSLLYTMGTFDSCHFCRSRDGAGHGAEGRSE